MLKNATKAVLTFGGSPRRGGFRLEAGEAREPMPSQIEMLRKDKIAQGMVADGRLLDPKGLLTMPPEPEPEAIPSELGALSEAEALAAIARTTDFQTLERWYGAETRANVRAALNDRGAAVQAATAKPKKKSKG